MILGSRLASTVLGVRKTSSLHLLFWMPELIRIANKLFRLALPNTYMKKPVVGEATQKT